MEFPRVAVLLALKLLGKCFRIREADVVIRGAYGPSNLGDDLLMRVWFDVVKKNLGNKAILVSARNPVNAAKFLGCSESEVIFLNDPCLSTVVVLGGGGQFFQFGN